MVYWLALWEMDTVTRVQTQNESVGISHSANTLEKGIHPAIIPQALGKKLDRLGSLILVYQIV